MEITKTRKNHLRITIMHKDPIYIYPDWISNNRFIIRRWIIEKATQNKILSVNATDKRSYYNVKKTLTKILLDKSNNPIYNFAIKPSFQNRIYCKTTWEYITTQWKMPNIDRNLILKWQNMDKRELLQITNCLCQEPDLDDEAQKYRPLRILVSSELNKTFIQEKYFQLFYYLFNKLTGKNARFLQDITNPSAIIEVFHANYGTIGFVMPMKQEIIN